MEKTNYVKKSPLNLGITVLVLGITWATVYLIPFMQYTWYDPFREYLGGTHFQMSLLITIYGFGNVFLAPIGGWIADRFNYKWMYIGSALVNGVAAIAFGIYGGYGFAVAMWIVFAISSLLMNYPTHIKIIRDLAADGDQGKIFGFNEAAIGVGNVAVSALMNVAFIRFGEGVAGIKGVCFANAVVSFICMVALIPLLDDPKKTGMMNVKTNDEDKANFGRDFAHVAKHPETWCYALTIFCVYSFMSSMSYFTEYFTEVLGLTVVFSAWMAIIRQYGMQLVGSPIGGFISDKIKNPALICLVTYIIGLLAYILLMVKKSGWTVGSIIFLTMFMMFFIYMSRGCYYSTQQQVGVPRKVAATTAGCGAILGFSPDIFQFAMYGHWLDTSASAEVAYDKIFIFQIAVMIVGIVSALAIIRYGKKHGTTHGGDYDNPVTAQ